MKNKDKDYQIVLSDDNDCHQQRWYICLKIPISGGMSGFLQPSNTGYPHLSSYHSKLSIANNFPNYLALDDTIPGNTRNEGFRTKEDAKIALLIYIA